MVDTSPLRPSTSSAAPLRQHALHFDRVEMTFPDGTYALAPTTFDVGPGEFVTVVRPSGCG